MSLTLALIESKSSPWGHRINKRRSTSPCRIPLRCLSSSPLRWRQKQVPVHVPVALRIRKNKKKGKKGSRWSPSVQAASRRRPTYQALPARRPADATPVPGKTTGESRSATTPPPNPRNTRERNGTSWSCYFFSERRCVLLATSARTRSVGDGAVVIAAAADAA